MTVSGDGLSSSGAVVGRFGLGSYGFDVWLLGVDKICVVTVQILVPIVPQAKQIKLYIAVSGYIYDIQVALI